MIPNFVDDSDVFELITLLESDEDIHGAFVKAADDVSVLFFIFKTIIRKLSATFLV